MEFDPLASQPVPPRTIPGAARNGDFWSMKQSASIRAHFLNPLAVIGWFLPEAVLGLINSGLVGSIAGERRHSADATAA
jgi:hypothetical protein